jgi:hypothetical protein
MKLSDSRRCRKATFWVIYRRCAMQALKSSSKHETADAE